MGLVLLPFLRKNGKIHWKRFISSHHIRSQKNLVTKEFTIEEFLNIHKDFHRFLPILDTLTLFCSIMLFYWWERLGSIPSPPLASQERRLAGEVKLMAQSRLLGSSPNFATY